MSVLSTVSTFFENGGPFMYVILGVAVVILAIVIERLIVLGRVAAVNSGSLADDLVRLIQKGDVAGARRIVADTRAPATRVAHALLTAGTTNETSLQNAADGAATLALPRLARRLPHLNMLANVATLLGLLGTIFGLTTAFSAVGAADPAMRSAFLAAGISQALNTTAFGLIVAVPALLVHGFLVGRVEAIVEQVDEVSVRLIDAIARAGRGGPGTPARGTPSGGQPGPRRPLTPRPAGNAG